MTAPNITSVVPNAVANNGSVLVTISGVTLSYNQDINAVWLNGVAATIISQQSNGKQLIVEANPGRFGIGTGPVVVNSTAFGIIRLENGFTYLPPVILSVVPDSEYALASETVTIFGTQMGNGTDIVEVTLNGVAATIISQTNTTVTVTSNLGGFAIGIGNVTVTSVGYGKIFKQNAWTYIGANLTSVFPSVGRAAGGSNVTITGNWTGAQVTHVYLNTVAADVIVATETVIVVIAGDGSDHYGNGNVTVSFDILDNVTGLMYTYYHPPYISNVSPASSNAVAGTNVTISGGFLGNGSDITAVTLAGAPVLSILSQSSSSVVVTAANGNAHLGKGDVVVSSIKYGTAVLSHGWTYNPGGVIFSVSPTAGMFAGGTVVTIEGDSIGTGSDITAVLLSGITADILSQTNNSVTIRTNNAAGNEHNDTVVVLTNKGGYTQYIGFHYRPQPIVSQVEPSTGKAIGGTNVTISGSSLGNGTDITTVSLNNVLATILFQNSTTIVVRASDGTTAIGQGNIIVNSTNFGPAIYINGWAYLSCIICPKGTYIPEKCPTAIAACLNCTIGHYCDALNMTKPHECQLGTFAAAEGATICDSCIAGEYANTTAQSSCWKCDVGTYSNVTAATSSSVCQSCEAGGFCDLMGMTSPSWCLPGTASNVTGAISQSTCQNCPAGFFTHIHGSTICHPCSPGTYGYTCQPCPKGSYCDHPGTAIPSYCPAGTASNVTGANSSSVCEFCDLGFYSNSSGSAECHQCDVNTYAISMGSILCRNMGGKLS